MAGRHRRPGLTRYSGGPPARRWTGVSLLRGALDRHPRRCGPRRRFVPAWRGARTAGLRPAVLAPAAADRCWPGRGYRRLVTLVAATAVQQAATGPRRRFTA